MKGIFRVTTTKMSSWFTPIVSDSFLPTSAIVSTPTQSIPISSMLSLLKPAGFHGMAGLWWDGIWVLWRPSTQHLTRVRPQDGRAGCRGETSSQEPLTWLLPHGLGRCGKVSVCSQAGPLPSCHFQRSFCEAACQSTIITIKSAIKNTAAFRASKPLYKQ